MIDYSIAGKWADVVRAIAIIESSENPQATGDGGRAFGLLQCHPALFSEYYGRTETDFKPSVTDTWVEAQIKACASFFEIWDHMGIDLTVQAWNQGATAVFYKGVRAEGYLERFSDALNKVRAGK